MYNIFFYLVSSSISVSTCHITWLHTFWMDLIDVFIWVKIKISYKTIWALDLSIFINVSNLYYTWFVRFSYPCCINFANYILQENLKFIYLFKLIAIKLHVIFANTFNASSIYDYISIYILKPVHFNFFLLYQICKVFF